MKRIISVLVAAILAFSALPTAALAEHLNGKSNWEVTYTTDGKLSDNYSASEYVDQIGALQPGDDITLSIKLTHANEDKADWYLSNEVVKSLESGAAEGSAYEYQLMYEGPGGSRELYNSVVVGGDEGEGLKDATNALEDYIFLEQLSKGQTASVSLKVTLDGETEGNAYFDTLARLKMKFAVEPQTTKTNKKTVETGDDRDTRLFPFYVAMLASGVGFAVLAVQSVRLRQAERKEV